MLYLMKSNIYEGDKTIIIVGFCLKNMQPGAYKQLEEMNHKIFGVCLEEFHVNMLIIKIMGFIRANKVNKVIFASVDKSPHCVQLHYIQDELRKSGLENVEFINYVAVNNELIEISLQTILLSKSLCELNKLNNMK